VRLRGVEEGTCLGPSFLGTPLRGVLRLNVPHFGEKLVICSYNILNHIIIKYSDIKEAPNSNYDVFSTMFSKGPPIAIVLCK